MKLRLLLVAMFLAPSANAGMFSKMIAKVATLVAPKSPVTDTLDGVAVTGGIDSNLAPTELGTISQDMFKGWQTGGDAVIFMFTKKDVPSFLKIDGTVAVDGKPANYLVAGNYAVLSAASPAARRIEIATKKGDTAAFTVEPSDKKLKILSINGQSDKVDVDLSKDVALELEGTNIPKNALVKVGIAVNQVGIKSIYDACYVPFAAKVTVPAACFRNINVKPAAGATYNYKKSFLSVSIDSIENAKEVSGKFSSVQYTRTYSDGKFVNVKTEPDLNLGLTAKGSDSAKDGEVSYDFYKANAASSRPISQAKTIGLLSFGLTGKTIYENSVISEEKNENKEGKQVTVTETVTFPQQTDAAWDAVLEKFYPEIAAIVQQELGASVLGNDAIAKTAGYKAIAGMAVADANTSADVSRGYKGAKLLNALSFSDSFGINSANEKILKEAGADALLTLKLDLQAAKDGKAGVLVPTLSVELAGKINGIATNTQYFKGSVTGKGVKSDKIGFKITTSNVKDPDVISVPGKLSAEELDQIVRRSDLLGAFRKGLKELKAKELANPDYKTVWDLQAKL